MKCRVAKGGWYWLGIERSVGDLLQADDVQVEQWVGEGLVVPMEEIREAVVKPPETAVLKRKSK